MGDLREAGEAWERAVNVLDDLRHAKADEVRNKLRSAGMSAAGSCSPFRTSD
jgi:hypothetical protein